MTKSRCLIPTSIVTIGIATSMWLLRSDPVLFSVKDEGDFHEGNLICSGATDDAIDASQEKSMHLKRRRARLTEGLSYRR